MVADKKTLSSFLRKVFFGLFRIVRDSAIIDTLPKR